MDPLDTMTLDRTANRAREGELNSYAAYGCEQGVKGIQIPENCYGEKRNYSAFIRRAEETAAIVERREILGLRYYEAEMFNNLQTWLEDNIDGLDPSMMHLHGGEFSLEVGAGEPADPVYLLHRQYNSGPFNT